MSGPSWQTGLSFLCVLASWVWSLEGRELTYPTWGKLKSALKKGTCYIYIYIIPRRVYIFNIHIIHIMYNIYKYIDLYWGLIRYVWDPSKVMCFVFNPIARLFTVFSNMRLILCCFMPISKHVFNLKPPHLAVLIWLSVANARGRLCTQFRPEFSHMTLFQLRYRNSLLLE